MNTTRSLVCAVSALLLCACGSIKSTQIYGIPDDAPDGYVLEELKVGETPRFAATISRGSIDTLRNTWLDLRVGSGPSLRVDKSELDCTQTSSANRGCGYSLKGPAPPGSVVTSTWNARFRYGNPDSEAKSLTLAGTLVPHDLDWGLVLIFSLGGPEPAAIPMIDGVVVLEPNHDYTITATIQNNAGPVIPVISEARIVFDDSSTPSIVVPNVDILGLQTGASVGVVFELTTPATAVSLEGTLTTSFVSNEDDADPTNDVVTYPIRVVP